MAGSITRELSIALLKVGDAFLECVTNEVSLFVDVKPLHDVMSVNMYRVQG